MDPDAELLHRYLASRSEESFAAFVHRHLPLVYSAALRQVGGDTHRAQEVAQAVFTLFARKAGQLRHHPAPCGWLYTCTHHVAAKVRRSEQRRLRREREAQAMHDHTQDGAATVEWDRLRPVIDEAMLGLKEHDRTAVLLRFFENRTFAEIGAQLRLSENAARMRVDRALDALRSEMARRGIVSAAAALGVALSSQAAVAIPAGLAAAIASSVPATAAGGIAIFMGSTFFKTAVIAVVTLTGVTGLFFQHREIEKLRAENTRLQPSFAAANARNSAQTEPLAGRLKTEIERLQVQVDELRSNPANSWQERVDLLREMLDKLPEQGIPELQLATDDDWLDAAKEKLETANDYRRALAKLRNLATRKFVELLRPALTQYAYSHGGQFPEPLSQLQSYIDRPIDDAMWQHYIVVDADTVGNVRVGGNLAITQRSAVDPTFDQQFVIGPHGFGTTNYSDGTSKMASEIASEMTAMQQAWEAANPGRLPMSLTELVPYATTPKQKATLERVMDRDGVKRVPGS